MKGHMIFEESKEDLPLVDGMTRFDTGGGMEIILKNCSISAWKNTLSFYLKN